jgi:uridine kinase
MGRNRNRNRPQDQQGEGQPPQGEQGQQPTQDENDRLRDEFGPVTEPAPEAVTEWGPTGDLAQEEGLLDGRPLFWTSVRKSRSLGVPLPDHIRKLLASEISGDRGWIGPDGGMMSFDYHGRYPAPITLMTHFAKDGNTSGEQESLRIEDPGAYVITGASGVGKSLLLAHIARQVTSKVRDAAVRFYYVGERGQPRYQDCAATYAAIMNVAARQPAGSFLMVDSISGLGLSSGSGGGAREGGVDSAIYDYVRSASEIAQHTGVSIMLLANLLVVKTSGLREAFKGVADGLIFVDASEVTQKQAIITGDYTFRPRRQEKTFKVVTDVHAYMNAREDVVSGRRLPQATGSVLPKTWAEMTAINATRRIP